MSCKHVWVLTESSFFEDRFWYCQNCREVEDWQTYQKKREAAKAERRYSAIKQLIQKNKERDE